MAPFTLRALTPATWGDFAALAERHHGVWGGCWCLASHAEGGEKGDHRRARKEQRVRQGTAHAARVYLGDACVGWCQFGPPEERPRIKHRKAYEAGLETPPPSGTAAPWRASSGWASRAAIPWGPTTGSWPGPSRRTIPECHP